MYQRTPSPRHPLRLTAVLSLHHFEILDQDIVIVSLNFPGDKLRSLFGDALKFLCFRRMVV
jgi:hypothetical protein